MKIEIGCRVDVSWHKGVIKYIGQVDGYKGEWLGIDWDDTTRGKHDGTVNGIQYFKTR